ncbi:MAG: DUF928 domain-containing protein [Cyanobacteria bacterium P01_A01_bin.114]
MHLSKLYKLSILAAVILGMGSPAPSLAMTKSEDTLRQGLPGRRISGGSRVPSDACVTDQQPLMALVPDENLGLTSEASPTFWFSLPTVDASKSLEFGLFDENGAQLYQTMLSASGKAGVIGIDLGELEGAPALRVDQNYRWSLSIVCNAQNPSENLWVDGWVRRIELPSSVTSRLPQTPPRHQSEVYLEAGLWHEGLTQLAQQVSWSRTDPNGPSPSGSTAETQWQTLLESIDLAQAATAPVFEVFAPSDLSASPD